MSSVFARAAVAVLLGVLALLLVVLPHRHGEWFTQRSQSIEVPLPAAGVELPAGQGQVMLDLPLGELYAGDWGFLEYSIEGLGSSHRVLLQIQSAEGSEARALPLGHHVLPLWRFGAWRGGSPRLRLLVVGEDMLRTSELPAVSLRIERLQLLSGGMRPALRAALSEWFAPRPWAASSINGEGSAYAGRGGPWLPLWIGLCLASVLLVLPRQRRARMLPVLAGAWLVLHAAHLFQLGQRSLALSQLTSQSEAPLATHAELAALAPVARQLLAEVPPQARLLVWSEAALQRDYLPFLLSDRPVLRMNQLEFLHALPAEAEAWVLAVGPEQLPGARGVGRQQIAGVEFEFRQQAAAGPLRLLRVRRAP